MALVPLRFCVSETFCTSISWHLQHRQGRKVTGEAYRSLSADFSAHQQGPSAILQIAGNPSGKRFGGGEGFEWILGAFWAGPPFPLVPAGEGEEDR